MKDTIVKSLKDLLADRYLLVLLVSMLLMSSTLSLIIGLSIHPSERQLISHYSAFGGTQFYFDQWFYLAVFVVFGLLVSLLHSIISVKLLIVRGRSMAIMFAWLGIAVVIMGWISALTILNLRTLL